MVPNTPPSNPTASPEVGDAASTLPDPESEARMPTPNDEWLRVEYQAFNDRWENGVIQRRAGLTFFTGVQGAILTVIGDKLGALDTRGYALSIFGVIVCLVAWNNERRIGAYMEGYRDRSIEIEKIIGLSLITNGKRLSDARWTFSNRKIYQLYYFIMLAGWLSILTSNIFLDTPKVDEVGRPSNQEESAEDG